MEDGDTHLSAICAGLVGGHTFILAETRRGSGPGTECGDVDAAAGKGDKGCFFTAYP